jgi:hypothetical protein
MTSRPRMQATISGRDIDQARPMHRRPTRGATRDSLAGAAFSRRYGWLFRVAAVTVFAITGASHARAQAPDGQAARILKEMSDYMANQKTISLTFDSDIEVITPELQKIQFDSSGRVLLDRPDKIRVSRIGGYSDVQMIFNGKTLSINAASIKSYAQIDAPGSVDHLINVLRNRYGMAAPGADLLVSDSFHTLMDGVIDAKYIGHGVIDGIECEQLAFRNADTDWQIWIQVGPHPIPRKYVITTKTLTAAPQYTVVIRDWKTDVNVGPDAFAFTVPQGAKKVPVQEMSLVDEVPPGRVVGEQK